MLGVLISRLRAWIDVSVPSGRQLFIVAVGVGAYIVFVAGVSGIVWVSGSSVEPASHTAEQTVNSGDVNLLHVAFVVVGVAPLLEELAYRNGIQKLLTIATGGLPAVVLTSVVFAASHYTSYAATGTQPGSIGLALLVIFGGSLILGYTYHKTRNLLVPVLIHATINAFAFATMLLTA